MNPEPEMIPKRFTPDAELLAGRVILVTGAGSGLGRTLAVECARAGASVILSGRNLAKLERVYDEIETSGRPQPAILRKPSAANSANWTAWSTLRACWAIARRSSNTTCRPGAECCM